MNPFDEGEPPPPKDMAAPPLAAGRNALNMRHGHLPSGHDLLLHQHRRRVMLRQAGVMIERAGQAQHGLIHGRMAGRAAGSVNLAELNAARQQLASAVDAARGELDAMRGLSDAASLRLQLAMDRMARMMTTLSNILKTIGDTAGGITQNLK